MESGNKLIWGIVSLAFAVVIGIIILAGLRDATTAGSVEYNATASIITKLATAPTWIGILVVVGFAALVYGFVQIFRGGEQ